MNGIGCTLGPNRSRLESYFGLIKAFMAMMAYHVSSDDATSQPPLHHGENYNNKPETMEGLESSKFHLW